MLLALAILGLVITIALWVMEAFAAGMSDAPGAGVPPGYWSPVWVSLTITVLLFVSWLIWGGHPVSL